MKNSKIIILIFLLLNLLSCSDNKDRPPLEVLKSIQLVKVSGGKFEKKNDLDLKPNNSYGWFMLVRTNKENVEIKDVIHLPSPGVWSENTSLIVSKDKKNAMSKRMARINNGSIQGFWGISEGDPKGDYSEDIYVDNKHIKTFYYHIK